MLGKKVAIRMRELDPGRSAVTSTSESLSLSGVLPLHVGR